MSDIIRLLPDSLANQIAAGEVIQRPASVVKELLENAIDAGASQIQLLIKDAGKTLIQVIDNGSGMSDTDARMAFERHATSKIIKSEDLESIRTMGFRGEALASIAAVAQVELKTRLHDKDLGTRISISGSVFQKQEHIQTPAGTSFSVQNIFFNVPARRKFLKSDPVELKNILEEFEHIALAYPEIEMSCFNQDTNVYQLTRGNLKQRILSIFGKTISDKIVSVEEQTDLVNIAGFVGKVETSKKKRGDQYLFVNRRFIKSTYLHHAIKSAYESLIDEDAHPYYVLFLDIDPTRIDVNVHPSKHEIKFLDERIIYQYLRVAVRHAIGQYAPLAFNFDATEKKLTEQFSNPSFSSAVTSPNTGGNANHTNPSFSKPNTANQDWRLLYEGLKKPSAEENINTQGAIIKSNIDLVDLPGNKSFIEKESSNSKDPYQLHNTYIISPIASGFLIIDQHAAHQRILYDQYMNRNEHSSAASQSLLFPISIQFSGSDQVIMQSLLPDLKQQGFDIEYFGANNFILHGTPTDWNAQQNIKNFLEELIQECIQDSGQKKQYKTYIAHHIARYQSYPQGRFLTIQEMKYLIDQLFACTDPAWSPTGTKCYTIIEMNEIIKKLN